MSAAVSVVVPVRDDPLLLRCVRSVLAQDVDFELIVVDDGSAETTADEVAALADDPRVRTARTDGIGPGGARNAGVVLATAPYVAFLDSDDEALPGWLARCVGELAVQRAPLLFHGWEEAAADGVRTMSPAVLGELFGGRRGTFLPGTFVVARDVLDAVGGYVHELRYAENTELGLRLLDEIVARGEQPALIEHVLVRRHENPTRDYDAARGDAARWLLEHHADRFRVARRARAEHLAIVGVSQARLGDLRAARRWFARSLVAAPSDLRAWGRLAAALVPPAAARQWPRSTIGVRTRLLIACPGLGRTRRGYEAFADELAEALQTCPGLEVRLAQGGPVERPWATRVPSLPPGARGNRRVAELVKRTPSWVEYVTFTLGLLPLLIRWRPDVVLCSERMLATALVRVRRLTRHNYAVLFSNGGPSPPPFDEFDLVHQVTEVGYREALAAGEPASRHVVLPYGFRFSGETELSERRALRAELGLPIDRPIVVSIGALDSTRKRMDHVIAEAGRLDPPPFVLLLGQETSETTALQHLADAELGDGGWCMVTVRPDDVPRWAAAADVFALASVVEGFGRAYVDALAAGLLCIVHDGPVMRAVLGEHGVYADMHRPGALAAALASALAEGPDPDAAALRRKEARARFGWDTLAPQYAARVARLSGRG